MAIRVLIASDVRVYREGLGAILPQRTDFHVIGMPCDMTETLSQAEAAEPDVVLVDTAMPAAKETVAALAVRTPEVPIVALAVSQSEQLILEWAEGGIAGYVTREDSIADLVAAVENAVRGELRCSPRLAGTMLRRLAALAANDTRNGNRPELTVREHQILELVERGYSNKGIARHFRISTATVKNHIHSILTKLNVARRTEAAAWLRRNGNASAPYQCDGASAGRL